MELTKQEVLNLNNGLHDVGNLGGVKFAYAVSRNIAGLKSEVEALQKAYTPHSDFFVYEKKRLSLAESHSVKVKGQPQKTIENGIERYVIADQEKFDKKLKPLQKKYKKAIDDRKKQLKEFADLLKEKVKIELHTISIKDIPEGITAQKMANILLIVDEELPN